MGRAEFAKLLARALAETPELSSMVVALYGGFGSGKTSTLNLCLRHLEELEGEDLPLVVRFEPYAYSNTGELFLQFFAELGSELESKESGLRGVKQTLVRSKKRGLRIQEYDAKSESSHRRIPLSRDQLEALWAHRKRRNAEKLIAGLGWKESGLFFATRIGTPLNVQSLTYRSYRPLLEKAGCPRIRFHDQRHTFAVLALQNGMPPEVLKKTLGHSSIQITIDYYGHLFPDYQDDVLGKMDGALATLDKAV